MVSVKELAKWLKDEVEFLVANQEYVGGWYLLSNGLAATVLWEEGWGDEPREDVIQATDKPDWGLCAGILVYNKDDTPDGWFMPWDSKTGDIICETTGIEPNEDYEKLAQFLLEEYDLVKDCEIASNGEVKCVEKEPEEKEVEVETEVKEEALKEEKLHEDKEYSESPYKDIIAEHFDYDGDFEFLDVVASIIGRIDDFKNDEDIYSAIDDGMIYTYDQWKVLEHYCTPQDANWEVAFENLSGDIFAIAATISGVQDDSWEEDAEEDDIDLGVDEVDVEEVDDNMEISNED